VTGRIAILGAGAVGGMLGVLLAEAGHKVTMLASDRTSTAINIAGLTLRSSQYGELHAPILARPWLTAAVDVLFVTVKAPDLLAAPPGFRRRCWTMRRSCRCSTASTTSHCYAPRSRRAPSFR
jgi:ketopantoate reductase